jgi:hypothetical protein
MAAAQAAVTPTTNGYEEVYTPNSIRAHATVLDMAWKRVTRRRLRRVWLYSQM